MSRRQDRDIVTAHAAVRWLERAEGRNLEPMRAAYERARWRAPNDSELLAFLSDYTGERLDQIRTRILTANVRRAIALGANRVRRGRVWIVIEGGCVVTILFRRRVIRFGSAAGEKVRGRFQRSKGRQRCRSWVDGELV